MIVIFRRHNETAVSETSPSPDRRQLQRDAVLRRLCRDYPALPIREVDEALDAAWGVVPLIGDDASRLVEPSARERLDAACRRRALAEQRIRGSPGLVPAPISRAAS